MKFIEAFRSAALVSLFLVGAGPIVRGAEFDSEDFKEAKSQAEKGDAEAQLALGMMYFSGQGVPQHYGEALKWYRRAADQGNAVAQNNLATMFIKGHGVAPNPLEAAKWMQKAANQGFPKAQLNLGAMFADGIGVGRNPPEALRWFRRAADQGDAEGQRTLGRLYAEGQMVRADYLEAYKWFNLAAAQGDTDAQEARDEIAKNMNARQLAEAQRRASLFVPRKEPGTAGIPKGSGSGFFITSDGYLVTSYHVVESATRIVIKTKTRKFAAQVVKTDKMNDIALLKITAAFPQLVTNSPTAQRNVPAPAVPVAALRSTKTNDVPLLKVTDTFRPLAVTNSSSVKLGDSVLALGFPNPRVQGLEPKLTRGEINSLAGIRDNPRHFQMSAAVQPGNSGGPLLDRFGNVIGLVVLRLDDLTVLRATGTVPQNVNYALKSSYLVDFLMSVPAIQKNFKAPRYPSEGGDVSDWVSDAQESVAVVQVF